MLIITCGLPGTGKSTLARSVAERTGFTVLSSDIVRKEMVGLAAKEHRYEAFAKGIYTPDFTERTYLELLKRARTLLLAGRSVILDASFIRRSHRKPAFRLAQETGAQFACVLLEVPPQTVRSRLARRLARGADPSDARWESYVAQKWRFQRPTDIATERVWMEKTTRPAANTRHIAKWLEQISPLSFQK